MIKLMSEEQTREAFEQWLGFKPERVNHRNHATYRVDGIQWRWASFKAAFSLLMPIIEKQMEALEDIAPIYYDSNDPNGFSPYETIAWQAIQETKQVLQQLGEKEC